MRSCQKQGHEKAVRWIEATKVAETHIFELASENTKETDTLETAKPYGKSGVEAAPRLLRLEPAPPDRFPFFFSLKNGRPLKQADTTNLLTFLLLFLVS